MKAAAAPSTFERAYPSYEATRALDELRARRISGARPRWATRTSTTRRRTCTRRRSSSGTWRCCAISVFGNPHSTNPTSSMSDRVRSTRARRAVLAVLQRLAGRVGGRLHRQRQPGAQARRRVVPVRAGRPVPADVRQPQLGERHSRVRARSRRDGDLRSGGAAGDARGRSATSMRELDRARPGRPQPVRLSRAVELLRRAASARVDRARAGEGLGRAARRRGVHADQPARSRPLDARLRRAVVLQDVRLPDRRRLPARPQGGARQAAAPVVCGRHDHRRVGAGRQALSGRRRIGASRTARSTTWRCRPSRSACSTSSRSASTRFTSASAA